MLLEDVKFPLGLTLYPLGQLGWTEAIGIRRNRDKMRHKGQTLKKESEVERKGGGAAIIGRARKSRYCTKLKGRLKIVQGPW